MARKKDEIKKVAKTAETQEEFLFEDISSSSPNALKKFKEVTENYGNGAFKNLDKIIKTISFIVSVTMILAFAAVAVVLIVLDEIFTMVAIALFAVGLIISIIVLFLIYAVGHIVEQNNEILKKL